MSGVLAIPSSPIGWVESDPLHPCEENYAQRHNGVLRFQLEVGKTGSELNGGAAMQPITSGVTDSIGTFRCNDTASGSFITDGAQGGMIIKDTTDDAQALITSVISEQTVEFLGAPVDMFGTAGDVGDGYEVVAIAPSDNVGYDHTNDDLLVTPRDSGITSIQFKDFIPNLTDRFCVEVDVEDYTEGELYGRFGVTDADSPPITGPGTWSFYGTALGNDDFTLFDADGETHLTIKAIRIYATTDIVAEILDDSMGAVLVTGTVTYVDKNATVEVDFTTVTECSKVGIRASGSSIYILESKVFSPFTKQSVHPGDNKHLKFSLNLTTDSLCTILGREVNGTYTEELWAGSSVRFARYQDPDYEDFRTSSGNHSVNFSDQIKVYELQLEDAPGFIHEWMAYALKTAFRIQDNPYFPVDSDYSPTWSKHLAHATAVVEISPDNTALTLSLCCDNPADDTCPPVTVSNSDDSYSQDTSADLELADTTLDYPDGTTEAIPAPVGGTVNLSPRVHLYPGSGATDFEFTTPAWDSTFTVSVGGETVSGGGSISNIVIDGGGAVASFEGQDLPPSVTVTFDITGTVTEVELETE